MEQLREPRFYSDEDVFASKIGNEVKEMGVLPGESKTNVTRAKIVFEGVDECRKNIQEIRADLQSLNECIQKVNSNIKQLAKNMKEVSGLSREASVSYGLKIDKDLGRMFYENARGINCDVKNI